MKCQLVFRFSYLNDCLFLFWHHMFFNRGLCRQMQIWSPAEPSSLSIHLLRRLGKIASLCISLFHTPFSHNLIRGCQSLCVAPYCWGLKKEIRTSRDAAKPFHMSTVPPIPTPTPPHSYPQMRGLWILFFTIEYYCIREMDCLPPPSPRV